MAEQKPSTSRTLTGPAPPSILPRGLDSELKIVYATLFWVAYRSARRVHAFEGAPALEQCRHQQPVSCFETADQIDSNTEKEGSKMKMTVNCSRVSQWKIKPGNLFLGLLHALVLVLGLVFHSPIQTDTGALPRGHELQSM